MSQTDLAQVAAQVQTFWAPLFMKELRESLLLASLVNKEYDGQIKGLGDTVRVSQINAAAGQIKTVGVDADTFDSTPLTTQYVDIKADKRFVASFEFADLVMLQSQLGAQDSEIRAGLMFGMEKKINDYLYSLLSPSTSAPDHLVTGVTDFNAAQLSGVRLLASKAKWMKNKGWYGLLSPTYYSDLLNSQTLVSADFVPDAPTVGGQIASQRFGFNLLEDNSDGIAANSTSGDDVGLFFHPDFMHFVSQTMPTFKVSDLHSNHKFGFVISCDLVGGAKLGIDGDVKHIVVKNS